MKPMPNTTLTAKNVAASFSDEAQSANRYRRYAVTAEQEGYLNLASLFKRVAYNEEWHSNVFYRYLTDVMNFQVPIVHSPVPIALGDTGKNLYQAAMQERSLYEKAYPAFADTAEREGFVDIARSFRIITTIEKRHAEQFMNLFIQYQQGSLYRSPHPIVWECQNCGYCPLGMEAPTRCPCCGSPMTAFSPYCPAIQDPY